MSRGTKIQWADDSVNFWWGCTRISPGCDFCYAAEIAARFKVVAWDGPPKERMTRAIADLKAADRFAARHQQKRFVFVNSMSDFFDKNAQDAWRRDALDAIEGCENLVALILTKRPQNIGAQLSRAGRAMLPANVWLGTTAENQDELELRLPYVATQVAAKRFLSLEPLLGRIDLRNVVVASRHGMDGILDARDMVDWVIVGGESGTNARPAIKAEWIRFLRDQCVERGLPFFFKQWGEWAPYDRGHVDSTLLVDETAMDEPVQRFGKDRAGNFIDARQWLERPVG